MSISINYTTVIIATIASFTFGFLWYGPIFGRKWSGMMGMNREEMSQRNMVAPIIVSLVVAFLMAIVLDLAIIFSNFYLGRSGVGAALAIGLFVWIGFIVPVTIRRILWEKQSVTLWLFNETYNLLVLFVLGFILTM